MRYTLKQFIAILFSLTFCHLALAEAPVSVTARVTSSKITVGDEVRLLIQVERPRKYSVEPPSEKINLAPFEIKKSEVSPLVDGKNRVRETFILTLTIFELGDHRIPPVPITFQSDTGRQGQVSTEPLTVKVVSVGKKKTDKDDIRPIKGPVSLDLRLLRIITLAALAALLALFLAGKIFLRRRKRKLEDLESLKPPHERVFLELDRLKKKSYLETGKEKEFYDEFSNILRRYAQRSLQIDALELTTFELIKNLKEREFDGVVVEKIREVLQDTDLVKFAKYIPPKSWAERLESLLVNIVEKTKPTEERVKK